MELLAKATEASRHADQTRRREGVLRFREAMQRRLAAGWQPKRHYKVDNDTLRALGVAGHTLKEIATRTGLHPDQVRSRLRALQLLPPAKPHPPYEQLKLRDRRLWLYGVVPAGFWKSADNRHLYMDWLGERLRFTQPEDWYQVSSNDFLTRGGSRLLQEFGSSWLIGALKDYRPEYEWLEWRFTSVPTGFWDDPANRRRYLDWLGKQLSFRRIEDWYQLTQHHVEKWYGATLVVKKFGGSPFALVKDYLPHYDWKEWLFARAPQHFWQNPANRRRYLDWLGQQLGFHRPEDWYQLSVRQLQKHHGSRLLKKFRNSPSAIVKDYLPQYDWKEWLFNKPPRDFWPHPRNYHRYLDWLGTQLVLLCQSG